MTNEEKTLKELKELAKEANKRINALEKFAGYRTAFATKQLFAYIENEKVQGVGTKIRKVRSDDFLTETQKVAIIKALKDFLADEASTVKGAKKIVAEYSAKAGHKLTPRGVSIMYQAWKGWKYYEREYDLASDFWQDVAPYAVIKSEKDWLEMFFEHIDKEVDLTVIKDAKQIYKELNKTWRN